MKGLYKIILRKDLRVIMSNKMMWVPMLVLPVIFTVLIPAMFFILAQFPESSNDFKEIGSILGNEAAGFNDSQLILYFCINFMMPSLFLIIPIMSASVIAGTGFVAEKEHKTIETLLYSPIKVRDLFIAKIYAAFIPSFAVTLISFIVFSIVVMIGQSFSFDDFFFPNLKWTILIFWVSPAISILAILIMIVTSAKSKNFQEAQQKVIFIILPVIVLTIGQATGLFALSTLILVILGLVIFLLNYILLTAAANSFVPEKLIK